MRARAPRRLRKAGRPHLAGHVRLLELEDALGALRHEDRHRHADEVGLLDLSARRRRHDRLLLHPRPGDGGLVLVLRARTGRSGAAGVELHGHPPRLEASVGVRLAVAVREPHDGRGPAPVELRSDAVLLGVARGPELARHRDPLGVDRAGARLVVGEVDRHPVDDLVDQPGRDVVSHAARYRILGRVERATVRRRTGSRRRGRDVDHGHGRAAAGQDAHRDLAAEGPAGAPVAPVLDRTRRTTSRCR